MFVTHIVRFGMLLHLCVLYSVLGSTIVALSVVKWTIRLECLHSRICPRAPSGAATCFLQTRTLACVPLN